MENMQPVAEEAYPVKLEVVYPQTSSRLLALLSLLFLFPKMLMVIPHFIVLYFLGIVTFLAWIFSQFAVLFTGKYPKGAFDFIVGTARWQARVNAYFMGLTDKYPPFTLN